MCTDCTFYYLSDWNPKTSVYKETKRLNSSTLALCFFFFFFFFEFQERRKIDQHVWYRSWTPCWGTKVMAEESSSCDYHYFPFLFSLLNFPLYFINFTFPFRFNPLMFVFLKLGFRCQTRDSPWWHRQFDGLALHYSWQGWGAFFSLYTYFFALASLSIYAST